MFNEKTELWMKRVAYYKTLDYQLTEPGRFCDLLDMNADLGGFAAAMIDDSVWVMNVVPVVAEINTLGVVYEHGLIGTYQNWFMVRERGNKFSVPHSKRKRNNVMPVSSNIVCKEAVPFSLVLRHPCTLAQSSHHRLVCEYLAYFDSSMIR